MPPSEFEPTISAHERPLAYALDRAVTRSDISHYVVEAICKLQIDPNKAIMTTTWASMKLKTQDRVKCLS
jgi:hypothetical protein